MGVVPRAAREEQVPAGRGEERRRHERRRRGHGAAAQRIEREDGGGAEDGRDETLGEQGHPEEPPGPGHEVDAQRGLRRPIEPEEARPMAGENRHQVAQEIELVGGDRIGHALEEQDAQQERDAEQGPEGRALVGDDRRERGLGGRSGRKARLRREDRHGPIDDGASPTRRPGRQGAHAPLDRRPQIIYPIEE